MSQKKCKPNVVRFEVSPCVPSSSFILLTFYQSPHVVPSLPPWSLFTNPPHRPKPCGECLPKTYQVPWESMIRRSESRTKN